MVKGTQYKLRVDRGCEKCGTIFQIIPSNINQANRRFCSKVCSYGMAKGKYVGDKSPLWIDKISISCEICSQQFEARPLESRKTCSRECANKSFQRRITLVCQACHKSYETRAKYAKTRKYCSRTCRTAGMANSNTSIERKVAEILQGVPNVQAGYPFERFVIDFAIPSIKLFIECDGTYWHSLPATQYRDRVKDRLATEQGWHMLRLSEVDINQGITTYEYRILSAIESQTAKIDPKGPPSAAK